MTGDPLPKGVTVYRGREKFTGDVPDGIIVQMKTESAPIVAPAAAPATTVEPKPAPDAETAEAK